jgi:hypothetical protein
LRHDGARTSTTGVMASAALQALWDDVTQDPDEKPFGIDAVTR